MIGSVEIDSNRFCSITGCYPLSVSTSSVFHLNTSILRAHGLMTIPKDNSPLLDFKYNLYFYLRLLRQSAFEVDNSIVLSYNCSFTFVMFCNG